MHGGKKCFDGLGFLAGAEYGSFIVTPFKVSALNVDFDLKINLIVFGPEIGSAPSNFFSGGRGVLQTEDSSAESYLVVEEIKPSASETQGLSTLGISKDQKQNACRSHENLDCVTSATEQIKKQELDSRLRSWKSDD
ncbi:hypothetical protein Tco_1571460 [Tanacetum coccineum]